MKSLPIVSKGSHSLPPTCLWHTLSKGCDSNLCMLQWRHKRAGVILEFCLYYRLSKHWCQYIFQPILGSGIWHRSWQMEMVIFIKSIFWSHVVNSQASLFHISFRFWIDIWMVSGKWYNMMNTKWEGNKYFFNWIGFQPKACVISTHRKPRQHMAWSMWKAALMTLIYLEVTLILQVLFPTQCSSHSFR